MSLKNKKLTVNIGLMAKVNTTENYICHWRVGDWNGKLLSPGSHPN